jgi:DDE superfamily endonuclease
MRLFESVLATLANLQRPQRKFLCHLMRLVLMLPGHVTFRNLSRYSPYHEKTFARHFATSMDFVALNKAAITCVVPPDHEQALVLDASFVPKSGKHTYGLARFWNGTHSRTEKGLEISALGWLDVTDNCAYVLSVEQTPPTGHAAAQEATRIDIYLDQVTRVVQQHALYSLRYVVTDGYYSKQKFLTGVRSLGLHQIGKLRRDANLRYLYNGPPRSGPGRPKQYDGKVHWADLARFEQVASGDDGIVLYTQVVNHVQFKCNVRVVVVVETCTNRSALLFSTDIALAAARLYGYYKTRFQVEFLFRDAKQFTGLSDCQARSQAKLAFHFNMSLMAVTFAKLEARQNANDPLTTFSMASLKRRYFNQHLIDRILSTLAKGTTLDKSSPAYERLCNYGTITELVA